MSNIFADTLPNPDDYSKVYGELSPEPVLSELVSAIDSRYNGKITANFTDVLQYKNDVPHKLVYTFYLTFTRHQNYIYPLFVAECKFANGQYPIKLQSHYAPPKNYGEVKNKDEFNKAVLDILSDMRTRNLILSMY